MEISALQNAHSIILNHKLKLLSNDLPIQLQTVLSMQWEEAMNVYIYERLYLNLSIWADF